MELEQREMMTKSGEVRPEERKTVNLISPFMDTRVADHGVEGSWGVLAPLFPDSKWTSDYRGLSKVHKHETQQRLESVPYRARPGFSRGAVLPARDRDERYMKKAVGINGGAWVSML